MYPVISTGMRTLIKRPVIVTLVRLSWTHNLIINFIFPDAEALEISPSAKMWLNTFLTDQPTKGEMVYMFILEYRVILGKEQGKSRMGKNYQIRKRKKIHQIFDISSPPEYELSLLFGPVCCVSLKRWQKNKERNKEANEQKRVSRNDKIHNSFRQRRQWNINQRALWSCSFMLWLKFVLISWTCWI